MNNQQFAQIYATQFVELTIAFLTKNAEKMMRENPAICVLVADNFCKLFDAFAILNKMDLSEEDSKLFEEAVVACNSGHFDDMNCQLDKLLSKFNNAVNDTVKVV